jgi:trigger factor
MPTVVREDIDALNAVLTVTIAKNDYEPTFKKELNKIKDRGAIKGFRKGKTPLPFLKKMYGKGLLSEIVTDLLHKELTEAIKGREIQFMGQPIPSLNQPPVSFDYDNLSEYIFKFDLGVAPDFEVKGVDMNTTYDYYKVQIGDEKVNERFETARKHYGEQVDSTEPIAEDDMVYFSAVEMDGDAPKEDGWKTTFSVLASRIAEGSIKDEIKSKQKGDKVRLNIFELEEGTSREFVKKYLLNFTKADLDEGTETGEMYEATIESVTRRAPAELNQEFYDKVFGPGEVYNEEEAKARIAESLGGAQQGQADSLLYRELRQRLIDLNRDAMPLPNEFIKRWVRISHEQKADPLLEDYDAFSDNMRWTLITDKLSKQYEIEVTEEDVRQMAYNRVSSYFGGYGDPKMLEPIVNRMMEDKESLNGLAGDVLADKLFYKIKENIGLNNVGISEEDLKAKYDAVMQAEEAKAKLATGSTVSEEEE